MPSNSSYLITANLVENTLQDLYRLIRRYLIFHTVFIVLIALQLLSLLFLIPLMAQNIAAAVVIATTFLTLFTYLVLRFYFQSRKVEQLLEIKNQFIQSAEGVQLRSSQEQLWSLDQLSPIYHLIHSLHYTLSDELIIPSWVQITLPGMKQLTHWCLWEDAQWMKETLHRHALDTLLQWVKQYPLDLELHKTFATAYMACYAIYQIPKTESILLPLIKRQYELSDMKEKMETLARLALEELNILLHHNPHHEWALTQLATIYGDLNWKEKEKSTYELLLSLENKNINTLYSLGLLCFELGDIAQGLSLYQQLQEANDPRAHELITHYGSFSSLFFPSEKE
ncbi:MAG: hypothetical protein QRY72_04555 [Candidatus Rhabdochlamydia sp.]